MHLQSFWNRRNLEFIYSLHSTNSKKSSGVGNSKKLKMSQHCLVRPLSVTHLVSSLKLHIALAHVHNIHVQSKTLILFRVSLYRKLFKDVQPEEYCPLVAISSTHCFSGHPHMENLKVFAADQVEAYKIIHHLSTNTFGQLFSFHYIYTSGYSYKTTK